MGGQQSVPVEEQAFNLKFTAKQMTRLSDKIYKKAEKEKEKIKTAIAANNIEGMQDYAEDSIRKKDEALKMFELSRRCSGVASRLEEENRPGLARHMNSSYMNIQQAMITGDVSGPEAFAEALSRALDQLEQRIDGNTLRAQPSPACRVSRV